MRLFLSVFMLGFFLLEAGTIYARDISEEQFQVRQAQDELRQATSDLDHVNSQIKILDQRVNQLSAQLDALKKDQVAKQARFNKAKVILDEKSKLLDKAWEENKKSPN
jgi:chromosome segregation ATPase